MENDMLKVSIIMPVYNSEKYLSKAIESVLIQSYRNFELILVDDGSSDNSGNICDYFAKEDKRIKVIHKENGGICSARNTGLEIVTGDYITFIDNDDEYLENFLFDNIHLAFKYNVDVVRFRRKQTLIKDGKIEDISVSPDFEFKYYSENECFENYNTIRKVGYGVWTGLYKTNLIKDNNIKFYEGAKGGYEDWIFNFTVYSVMKSIVLNSGVYYNWILRETHSTSAKFNQNRFEAIKYALSVEEKNITKNLIIDTNNELKEEILISYIKEYLNSLLLKKDNIELSYVDSLFKDLKYNTILNDLQYQTKKTKNLKDKFLIYMFNKNRFKVLYVTIKMIRKAKSFYFI